MMEIEEVEDELELEQYKNAENQVMIQTQ